MAGGKRTPADKELSKADVTFLANLPPAVEKAFNVLVDFGADAVRLCKLIKKRKKSGGRPSKAEETARLIHCVECYQEKHPGVTIKDAITRILEPQASFKHLSRAQRTAKVHSLEVAYSREIRKRQAQESESMDEYAARRQREMRSASIHKTPPKM